MSGSAFRHALQDLLCFISAACKERAEAEICEGIGVFWVLLQDRLELRFGRVVFADGDAAEREADLRRRMVRMAFENACVDFARKRDLAVIDPGIGNVEKSGDFCSSKHDEASTLLTD